ncbi:unnamed protein product [Acanthoscelides obtectus]|uniref:Uncharacterized protein n=1 Tax=Acanthoscelides obtectus TaxID=200917 RepID=A0A9P0MJY0_ACAOB|nr:unnamed protein product [Acanthoscelides obtectus]CAK1634135.1 hypothetical protein AOBTE_LOCUS8626 [Acanthoscelides obtectus]
METTKMERKICLPLHHSMTWHTVWLKTCKCQEV